MDGSNAGGFGGKSPEISFEDAMLIYDKLPPIVRKALANAWGNYFTAIFYFKLQTRTASQHDIVAEIQRADLRDANKALDYTPANLYDMQKEQTSWSPSRKPQRSSTSATMAGASSRRARRLSPNRRRQLFS